MKHRNIDMKHETCETKVGKEKQQCSETLQQDCTKNAKQKKNKSWFLCRLIKFVSKTCH